jgi:hypothetical protein
VIGRARPSPPWRAPAARRRQPAGAASTKGVHAARWSRPPVERCIRRRDHYPTMPLPPPAEVGQWPVKRRRPTLPGTGKGQRTVGLDAGGNGTRRRHCLVDPSGTCSMPTAAVPPGAATSVMRPVAVAPPAARQAIASRFAMRIGSWTKGQTNTVVCLPYGRSGLRHMQDERTPVSRRAGCGRGQGLRSRLVATHVLAVVLADGESKRLMPLTADQARPAVPFDGTHRMGGRRLEVPGSVVPGPMMTGSSSSARAGTWGPDRGAEPAPGRRPCRRGQERARQLWD